MSLLNKNCILRVVTIISLIMFLSGCIPFVESTSISIMASPTVNLITDTAAATVSPTPFTPETTSQPELGSEKKLEQYSFQVVLDYNKHTLDVVETINYINDTGSPLTGICLVVPPNHEKRVFNLSELQVNGLDEPILYRLEDVQLIITLPSVLAHGDQLTMVLKYQLDLKINGGILGYTVEQMNLSDWYPFVPPFDQENGWVIHSPAEVGEYLVYDLADFSMDLTLVNPQGLIVAGSTEAVPLAVNRYQLVQPGSRNLTFSVSDQYQVLQKDFGGITVRAFIFKDDTDSGWAAVENTGNALLYFGEKFGLHYPHDTMTIVESAFPDGMEYDGLYYLSGYYFKQYDGSFQNYLSLLSVHETAHQWWFGLIGSDQALEPWLDEALATYSEYLFIERYHTELTDWWWQYRIAEYQPAGKVNLTIYDKSDLRAYINAVYLQGASFLHKLRNALGDEAFFNGLTDYVTHHQSSVATWESFLQKMVTNPNDITSAIQQEYFK